jgi:hypothetical protein
VATTQTLPLLVAVIGVVGGLTAATLGPLLNQRATQRQEERRWKRDDLTRWQQERRQSYIRFLVAGDALSDAQRDFVRRLREVSLDQARAAEAFTEGLQELMRRWEEIRLLATGPVVSAAAPVLGAAVQLFEVGRAGYTGEIPMEEASLILPAVDRELIRTLADFRAAARAELAIEGRMPTQ